MLLRPSFSIITADESILGDRASLRRQAERRRVEPTARGAPPTFAGPLIAIQSLHTGAELFLPQRFEIAHVLERGGGPYCLENAQVVMVRRMR